MTSSRIHHGLAIALAGVALVGAHVSSSWAAPAPQHTAGATP